MSVVPPLFALVCLDKPLVKSGVTEQNINFPYFFQTLWTAVFLMEILSSSFCTNFTTEYKIRKNSKIMKTATY
jgi:hypothetical protein